MGLGLSNELFVCDRSFRIRVTCTDDWKLLAAARLEGKPFDKLNSPLKKVLSSPRRRGSSIS